MCSWETVSEEASIVLVGNFNPKIFHPEWFIRKSIIDEWDYSDDDVVNLPDLCKVELPSDRNITVLLNQFILRSSLASDHLALKDFVMSTFSYLKETPVKQMGMNYISIIKLADHRAWMHFTRDLAPHSYWEKALNYFGSISPKKREELGLWDMTMNLPRKDDIPGHIRAKISVNSSVDRTLSFSINNHVEIDQSDAEVMIRILDEQWESSLELSKSLISDIMISQLAG